MVGRRFVDRRLADPAFVDCNWRNSKAKLEIHNGSNEPMLHIMVQVKGVQTTGYWEWDLNSSKIEDDYDRFSSPMGSPRSWSKPFGVSAPNEFREDGNLPH